jgi:hypothetical protein
MPTIHPKARTTPAVRAEIARSTEPTGVLARRYGVSTETIRKWRKRGPGDCQDHSSRPTSSLGKPPRRSAPLSVRCGVRRVFLWMTLPLWSPTSCRISIETRSTAF